MYSPFDDGSYIFLGTQMMNDYATANTLQRLKNLLYLDSVDPGQGRTIYINSPGAVRYMPD